MIRSKSKSKKTARTVIGRSSAGRRSGEYSKNKRAVDDRGSETPKLLRTRQGRGEPLGQNSLTPERIRSVKKKIMAQRRAQRRRMGEVRTASEALSHEIDQYKQVLDRSRLHLEVLHKLPAVAWTVTRHGSCEFVNQFYLDATGLSADYCTAPLETWRKNPSDLPPFLSNLHPDHKERLSHVFWEGVQSGGGWTFEAPFLHADGSYHWHFDRAVPVRDAQGKVLRFVGSSSDIQELRSERDSLADRERRLLAIIDGSPNPIFLKDPDGRFLLVNREFERITGVSRDQIIGKTEDDLSKLREAGALRTNDREVPRSGEAMLEPYSAPSRSSCSLLATNANPLSGSTNSPKCFWLARPWVVNARMPPGRTTLKSAFNHLPNVASGMCEKKESANTASNCLWRSNSSGTCRETTAGV